MKNTSGPEGSIFRKKGFFIALYSCLGAVAAIALVITFATRTQTTIEPEETHYVVADQVESYLAQADPEAWFRPRQTPEPTPQPATPPPRTTDTPPPRSQPAQPQVPDPPTVTPDPPPTPPAREPEPPPAAPRVETFEPFTEDDRLVWPVYGEIIMPFSMNALVYDPTLDQFRTNDNLRITAPEGEPVRAGADGRVVAVGRNVIRGNYVIIDHGDGWKSTYGQLMENILVSEGDIVRASQVIGGVGQPSMFGSLNGTHVHLRITRDNEPMNPYELLQARN